MYKAEEPYQSAAYTIHTLQPYLTLSGNLPLCFCIKLIKISREFVSLSTLKFCCVCVGFFFSSFLYMSVLKFRFSFCLYNRQQILSGTRFAHQRLP